MLAVRIGSYVAHNDVVAEIHTAAALDTTALGEAVLRALKLARARDLQYDAAHGVEQIMNIGWTSISSAQHNPSAGAQAIHALRDLLASWSAAPPPRRERPLPVVYDDNIALMPLRAIESLAVAAVESRQHQSFGHAFEAMAAVYERLPPALRAETDAIMLRLLSGLPNQLLTTGLDEALRTAAAQLEAAGGRRAAEAITRGRRNERTEVARRAE